MLCSTWNTHVDAAFESKYSLVLSCDSNLLISVLSTSSS